MAGEVKNVESRTRYNSRVRWDDLQGALKDSLRNLDFIPSLQQEKAQ